jgi:hypothetical protein
MSAIAAGLPATDPENSSPGVPGTAAADRIAALRAQLATPMPDDRLWGWIGPLLVTLFAGFLRFSRLSAPNAVIFDETYYAKDAWSILQHGVEWNWLSTPPYSATYANNQILAGHFTPQLFQACSGTGCGEYVVQPELGKLLIAAGEWLYGLTAMGWRFSSAVIGTLAILLMCRVVHVIRVPVSMADHPRGPVPVQSPAAAGGGFIEPVRPGYEVQVSRSAVGGRPQPRLIVIPGHPRRGRRQVANLTSGGRDPDQRGQGFRRAGSITGASPADIAAGYQLLSARALCRIQWHRRHQGLRRGIAALPDVTVNGVDSLQSGSRPSGLDDHLTAISEPDPGHR